MYKIFTIIIPVFNAERTIERTLASFISNKDYIAEVIIVDDYCTDNTINKITSFQQFFPIKILKNEGSHNPGKARKVGMLAASTDWITFVDADDCLTPSSLYYVYEQINKYEDIKILHTQTIYYESGSFNKDSISRMDNSCGGNFYYLPYLIKNNLFPHNDLKMAEDEFFNEKINRFITYCDEKEELNIKNFEYPVYEVHHDIQEGLSFALSNWVDYLCKYHLLSEEYLIDFFLNKIDIKLMEESYIESFIFCFFLIQGLLEDDDIDFDLKKNLKYFKRALQYFKNVFETNSSTLINYYHNIDNLYIIDSLCESAKESTGIDFEYTLVFDTFISQLEK